MRKGSMRRAKTAPSARLVLVLVTLVVLLPRHSTADLLTSGGVTRSGRFAGYRSDHFSFAADDGAPLDHHRGTVQKLALEAPLTVTLLRSNQAPPGDEVLLSGFEAGAFSIERSGRVQQVPALFVASISVPAPAAGTAAAPTPGPRPAIDVAALERSPMSEAQRALLDDYREARRDYDAFVAESSALVAQLDTLTGARRMELLEKLRHRNHSEQPLATALRRTEQAVRQAFGDHPGTSAGTGTESHPAQAGTEPREWRVMLIDVQPFRGMPGLTALQQAAIARYESSTQAIQAALTSADEATIQSAAAALQQAETALLQAFPDVVLDDHK